MKCNSSNIIYMIECASCGIQHIVRTKRSLWHKFDNYRQDILRDCNASVALYFNQLQCEATDCKNYSHFPMPQVGIRRINDPKKRLEIEQNLIGFLKTYSPFALNIAQGKCKDTPTIKVFVPYSGLVGKASQISKYIISTSKNACLMSTLV